MVNEIKELYNQARESVSNLEKAVSKVKVRNKEGFPLVSKSLKIELWKMKLNLDKNFILDEEYGLFLWDEIERYSVKK